MFDCHFPSRYDRKKRFAKKVRFGILVWDNNPLNVQRRGRCRKVHGFRWLRCFKHLKWMTAWEVDLSPWSPNVLAWLARRYTTYGTGWCARGHTAILFHRNFSPTKKIAGDHLFIRRSSSARHPITQATNTKKAGGIVGGIKDDCATLDCWFDYSSSLQLFETCSYGGKQGGTVDYGIGESWS